MKIQYNITNNATARNGPNGITISRLIYYIFHIIATMFINKSFKLLYCFGETDIIDMCVDKVIFIH